MRLETLIALLMVCLGVKAQYNVDRLLTSGRIALHYEDYVLSIQYFNQAISQKPYLWEPWQLRAIAKYYLDDWDGAEADATQAIKMNPYITGLYDLRGISYIRQKDYDAAIKDYTKAISLEPNERGYWYNRAACYLEKKSYDTAQVQLDIIINKWKKYAPTYLMKAETYLCQKDTDKASQWIDKALTIESYNADAWRMKGALALQHSNWRLADSCLTKTLHYKPKDVSSYVNRALARLRINNLRGAMSDYDIALQNDPNNFLAHYNRGLLRQQVGDDNRAIEDFNYVLSLEPGNILALFNRATLLDRTGDLRGAIRDYSIVIKKFPNFWTGLHYRAECYRRLGMTTKAEQDEFRIFKAQMDKHLGIQNRWSKAKLNAMRKLSDIDPEKYNQIVVDDEIEKTHEYSSNYRGKVQNRQASESFQPYLALTMSLGQKDNISTYVPYEQHCTQFIEDASRLTKKSNLLRVRIGCIGEGTGSNTFAATDSLTSMIMHSSDQKQVKSLRLLLAVAYSSAMDYQNALDNINKVLQTPTTSTPTDTRDNFVALFQRAVCSAMVAEYDRTSNNGIEFNAGKKTSVKDNQLRMSGVMSDFKKLLEMDSENTIVLYCYATFCARNGDYQKAIELYSKAIKISPRMPYCYYNRGLCYLKSGKPLEARKDFSKSGELGLYGAYSLLKKK